MIQRLFCVFFSIAFCCQVSVGDELPVVLVLFSEKNSIIVQLEAELVALGYQPVLIQYSPTSLSPGETARFLKEHGATALVNVSRQESGVEVWVGAPFGGGTLVETVEAEEGAEMSTTVILKSVESLRASLMRFDNLINQKEDGQSGEPNLRTNGDRQGEGATHILTRNPRLLLDMGVASCHGFGALSLPLQFRLALRLSINERFAVEVAPYLPVYPMKAENAQGDADVWSGTIILGVRGYLTNPDRLLQPWLGVGIGPYVLRIKGRAEQPPDITSEDLLVTPVVAMSAGLLINVADTVAVYVVATNLISIIRQVVVLGDERLKFGNPILGGSVGVTFVLF